MRRSNSGDRRIFTMEGPSVIGCLDSDKQRRFYRDLTSSPIPAQKANHNDLVLGRFIPVVKRILNQKPAFKSSRLFAVSLSTLIEKDGSLRYKSAEQMRTSLKLPLNARVGLIGTAQDHPLELFWTKSEVHKVWSRLAGFRLEFATSLTFSVWDKHPRFDQIYNQERNFFTHDLLISHGISSIPFCFSFSERDHREVVAWLKEREDVRKVAVLAQMYDTTSDLEPLINNMRALEDDVQRQLQFLVVGTSTAEKIDRILGQFSDATIATDQPIFKAAFSQRTLPDLSHIEVDKRIGHGRLAVENVEAFDRYCSQPRLWDRAA